ncbi:MAG: hypothetical protein ACOC1V_07715 [Candidatus Saliniplasma sp.]
MHAGKAAPKLSGSTTLRSA